MLKAAYKLVLNWWDGYKFRSLPWVVMQFRLGNQRNDNSGANDQRKDEDRPSLKFQYVSQKQDALFTVSELEERLPRLFQAFECVPSISCANSEITRARYDATLLEIQGFSLDKRHSLLGAEAGYGIFLARGKAAAGSVIALYPGTIYRPWEPLLLASIRNKYILRCKNGLLIDGKSKGISKQIYQSCAARDKFGLTIQCCDTAWLTTQPGSPLNMGQYVNNENKVFRHNVMYQECMVALPDTGVSLQDTSMLRLNSKFWKFLPNVWYDSNNSMGSLMIVPLVAVRDIHAGEEILSAYHTLITEN